MHVKKCILSGKVRVLVGIYSAAWLCTESAGVLVSSSLEGLPQVFGNYRSALNNKGERICFFVKMLGDWMYVYCAHLATGNVAVNILIQSQVVRRIYIHFFSYTVQ